MLKVPSESYDAAVHALTQVGAELFDAFAIADLNDFGPFPLSDDCDRAGQCHKAVLAVYDKAIADAKE